MNGFKLLLLFFVFPTFCHSATKFLHLNGYLLFADTLSTYSTTDDVQCLKECAKNASCMAVQMMTDIGECNLLTMIRNAVEAMECDYYIKNLTMYIVANRSLDPLEQVIQNAVYASQGDCPDGWTAGSTACTLSVSQSICNEYALFLKATWNGTECVMPKKTYSCPNSKLTLMNITNDYYCYAVIQRDYSVLADSCTYQQVNSYCYQQTGAYLASIHSEEENNFILSLQNMNSGMAIGLVPNVSSPTNSNQYIWLDKTPMNYHNINNNSVSSSWYVPFGLLMPNGNNIWYTNFVNRQIFWMNFDSLVCKTDANAVFSV